MSKPIFRPNRRDFTKLSMAAGATIAALTMASGLLASEPASPAVTLASGARSDRPTVLFVFTDQERYRADWPASLGLAQTGHIDFVPTPMFLTGATPEQTADYAGRELPGHDFPTAPSDPGAARVNTACDTVPLTCSGLASNDAEVFRINADARALGRKPIRQMVREGHLPDTKKPGLLGTMFDGRHTFSGYFAPTQHNSPRTLDQLFAYKDVGLFDHQSDPGETQNLVLKQAANADLILAMSDKPETIIKADL